MPTTVAPTVCAQTATGGFYVATRAGIQVCDQAGRCECHHSDAETAGSRISRLAAENFDTLFANLRR